MKMAIRCAFSGVGWVMPKVLMKMLESQRRGFIGQGTPLQLMVLELYGRLERRSQRSRFRRR